MTQQSTPPSSDKDEGRLKPEQRRERLALFSPTLVDELYAITKAKTSGEDARDGSLTAKATGLLTASGLALTVAFTFGGLLLQHADAFDALPSPLRYGLPILYFGALCLGLGASFWSLKALLIRDDYLHLSEKNVFRSDVLLEADRLERAQVLSKDNKATASQKPDAESASDALAPAATTSPEYESVSGFGTAYYRRFMIDHMWDNYWTNFHIHEDKAKKIQRGQYLFFYFLLSIALIGLVLTGVAMRHHHALSAPPNTVQCLQGAQGPAGPQGPSGRDGPRGLSGPPGRRKDCVPSPALPAGTRQ